MMRVYEEIADAENLYEHYRLVVDLNQRPLRVDKFLSNRLENTSRSRIQQAIAAGNVRINNNPVKQNYRVKPNDVISIVLSYPRFEIEVIPQHIPLDIVYEDKDLIVINKPAGMVVHPGCGNYKDTLINALMYHLKDAPLFKTGELRPGLVHRLDKDTSGLIVVAKTEIALYGLARQFFEKNVERTYIALVWGRLEQKTGTIEANIGRNPYDRKKMFVFTDREKGKKAITHYEVVQYFKYTTLVKCKLETGRTHQIRIHFKHINHPVFNDETYGGNRILYGSINNKYKEFINNCFKILPRQALHARSLGFTHPVTAKYMFFDSNLPDDMKQVIDKWTNFLF